MFSAFVLLFGLFYAWETRNSTFDDVNDSKLAGRCNLQTTQIIMLAASNVNLAPVVSPWAPAEIFLTEGGGGGKTPNP